MNIVTLPQATNSSSVKFSDNNSNNNISNNNTNTNNMSNKRFTMIIIKID